MKVGMIWAQDKGGHLGDGTGMCWSVPADFAHFKATTMGKPIIMGRKSFEALGSPLPGRENIVLTRNPEYRPHGATVLHSPEAVLEYVQDKPEVWITGGLQIYNLFMNRATELVVSYLDLESKADLPAPVINPAMWVKDEEKSDAKWRPVSGDGRWKVVVYRRLQECN